MPIHTVAELEELLSRPSPEDSAALRQLDGDLVILGAGGKMGPSLARRARRAFDQARARHRVIGVSRFNEPGLRESLERDSIETVEADLLDRSAVERLPGAPNVIFMAGRKFGTEGAAHLTWAMNVLLPALVAERYRTARIVAFSSGNVYPLRKVADGGATEDTEVGPVSEYAQSVLGRERAFEYCSDSHSTPVVLLRLNYAVEMRYGVLVDIGRKVFDRRPIDLTMGYVNVIWQGDANSVALRSFALCASPPVLLNLTGPETLPVRQIAGQFAKFFGVKPQFEGEESDSALLNDAGKCHRLFGPPSITADDLIEWTAEWIAAGGAELGKPTHFEVRNGRF